MYWNAARAAAEAGGGLLASGDGGGDAYPSCWLNRALRRLVGEG
jgi:hypothetical protein